MITVSSLNIYPLKSGAGLSLDKVKINADGPWFDRRFMVCDAEGKMLTARKFPQLLYIEPRLISKDSDENVVAVELSHPKQGSIAAEISQFALNPVATHVWKDDFNGYSTTTELDNWFSEILGQPVRLLYSTKDSPRFSQKANRVVSFADGYPLLLLSEASLAELNKRSARDNLLSQFRANIVMSGSEPFVEDSWQRIRIGEVEFTVAAPCARCIMTTFDKGKNSFHPQQEPLRTLSTFRVAEGGGIMFGVNLIALNSGYISLHDNIEVLATQPPLRFKGDIPQG